MDFDEVDRVAQTFEGKRVFITGGTGFIGKVLVEKLLRLCPNIGQIILLVRAKKGKDPQERVQEILNGNLFSVVLSTRTKEELMSKITAVNGELKDIDLGLSDKDRTICQTANIIVHAAASVRFDEDLKSAVLINLRATKYVLQLAKSAPNLELMIHVSTAYCYPKEKVLEEKIYPSPGDPHEILNLVETYDTQQLDVLTPKLMDEYPNTYTYSKALAEALVEEYMDLIPVMIIRPSIVIPIYKEPIKGWTDNLNGPVGLLIGAGKGVIRSMYGNPDGYGDFVPVDCVVSGILVFAWDYLQNGCRHKVVNFTTSDEVQLTWKELIELGKSIVVNIAPFKVMLWYPGGSMTHSRLLHNFRLIFFHWIPAILIDTLLFCLGYKPVLIRVHKRIKKSFNMLEYYTAHQWQFNNDTMKATRAKLNNRERSVYVLDALGANISEYYINAVFSAKRNLLHETDDTLFRCKVQMNILWFLDTLLKFYVCYYILKFLYQLFCNFI